MYIKVLCIGGKYMDDNLQDFRDSINAWGWSINARKRFNEFIDAIKTEQGLTEQIQRIQSIIDDIVLNKELSQFKKCLEVGTEYYRARIINPEDDGDLGKGLGKTSDDKFTGYNDINSREPILGMGSEGRNNIVGTSYLYIASNPETACMEIKSQFGDLISLAKFRVLKPLYVIDFESEKTFQRKDTEFYEMSMGVFFSQLMFRFTQPVRGENAYRATQIIADYLRKTGIDGIKYKSFLTPGGANYTIFNCHPSAIKFCESRVLIHKQANHSFWDFNNEIEIMSNKDGKMLIYDKTIADEHKKHLLQRFQRIEE